MRKSIFIVYTIFFATVFHLNCNAQSIGVGVGGAYDFSSGGGGIELKGIWNMSYRLGLSADINYFPKTQNDGNTGLYGRKTVGQLNLRYNIYPAALNNLVVYPIAGLGYSYTAEYNPDLNDRNKKSFNAPGINLGAGAGYKVRNITFYTEYRYSLSEVTNNILSIGIVIKDLLRD